MNNLETLKLGKTEKVLLRAKGNKSVTAVLKVVALGKKKKVRTSFTDPSLGIKNKGRYIVYSDSFKEAKVKLSDWESDQLAGEFGVSTLKTLLNSEQVKQAELAFNILGDKHSLLDAVNFFLKKQTLKSSTVLEAYKKWNEIGIKERNLRPETIRDRKNSMKKFVDNFGSYDLKGLTKLQIKKFIYKPKLSQVTINGHIRVFKAFFKFCVGEEWIKDSPIENLTQGGIDQKEPKILFVWEAKRLIESARRIRAGDTLAYFSLLLFTGLRPSEIHDGLFSEPRRSDANPLTWDHIDLDGEDEDEPVIIPPKTKNRKLRRIKIEPNCVALLRLVRHKPLFPAVGFKRKFKMVYEDAGIEWSEDVCRHSWVTYLFARDESLGVKQLSAMAGNTDGILEKAYLSRSVNKRQGNAFFKIGLNLMLDVEGSPIEIKRGAGPTPSFAKLPQKVKGKLRRH